MSDMAGFDPWAPVQHEDAGPDPEPTSDKPIKVAAHTRAPRQTEPKAEPKAEPSPAAATLPLALSVAVPTDLMAGFAAMIESQKALIAKIDALIGKIDALANAVNTTEPDPQPSLPGLQ